MTSRCLQIAQLEALVFRCPIATPVVTSFGRMTNRPAVFVRVEDVDGVVGWGEIWCNFPDVGAEHRARLLQSVLAPLVVGKSFASAAEVFEHLTACTAVLALQSGEPGPLAQCIAGLDIALWDLTARQADQPLWALLGGVSPSIAVYASGLNPQAPEQLAAARHAEGFRAFKLKVGFGAERDLSNLVALRATVGGCQLMVDANQAWSLSEAMAAVPQFNGFNLGWIEEPLRADRPWVEFAQVAAVSPAGLAAGENLLGDAAFDAALQSGALRVVQPDVAKWGGITRGLPLARRILASGARFCPHYLGAGVGLLAAAHLLAASGQDGMLEVDANPNPLRSLTCGPVQQVHDGRVTLNSKPGLGFEPDLSSLAEFAVKWKAPL